MSTLNLAERAQDAPLNGFNLNAAIGEALGAASVCWTQDGVFDSERAVAIIRDLNDAVEVFLRIAINQQSIDVLANTADTVLAERIMQAPAMRRDLGLVR